MAEVAEAVETAMGGSRVTTTVEGRQWFAVRPRYARDHWQDLESVGDVLVTGTTSPAELLGMGGRNGGGGSSAPPAMATPPAGSAGMPGGAMA